MGASDTTEKDWEEHWHSEQLEEAYQKGKEEAIDEYRELLKNYFVIPHDLRVIDMYAEQLKER